MWWINRLYLDGVGHEESFYKDMTLDFHTAPDGDAPRQHLNHSYLQLVNGGGKTTLISFFLTLFEPRKTQFVQVVSGRLRGNKYHYNDYFHPELSTLVMELVNQQGQRVVLGQYHQKINDETEVVCFLCDETATLFELPFDRIPSRSRAEQQADMKPFVGNLKLAREWLKQQEGRQDGLGHHWRVASTQADWQTSLKEIGVNIDMIKTMVTLNSEEGGIKRFASYQSERDFLSFFYGCVMARDNLDSLIESCQQEVKRGNEINEHRRDEAFYEQLLAKWRRFVPPATQHLDMRQAMVRMEDNFKEALRDLRQHADLLAQSYARSKDQVKAKQGEIEALQTSLAALRSLIAELEFQAATMKCEQIRTALEQLEGEMRALNEILEALDAVGPYQQWVGAKHDTETWELKVRLHREQHEQPLQAAFDQMAAQSLLIHRQAIERLDQKIADTDTDQQKAESAYQANQQHQHKTATAIGEWNSERNRLTQQEKKGREALEELKGRGLIGPSESPENAPIRWQKAVDEAAIQHARAKQACTDAGSELETCASHLQEAKASFERAGEQKTQALRERDAALHEHKLLTEQWIRLPATVHARTSSEPLDWNSHRVESRLAGGLAAMQAEANALMQRRSARQNVFDELKAAGHQLSSASVNRALIQLRNAGIAVDKVWAFPHYLAQVFLDDPGKIANKVDADPGRYMGIVVLDDATLAHVKATLSQLEWKERPVPVYLASDSDLNEASSAPVPDCVIAAPDKLLYSEKATQDTLAELKLEIESLTQEIDSLQHAICALQSFQANGLLYYRTYGTSWSARHDSVHETAQALMRCETAVQAAEDARNHQKTVYENAIEHEAQAAQVFTRYKEQLNTVQDFLSREWHDYRLAQQALPGVKQAIADLERKQQQLHEDSQQLSNKKQRLNDKLSRLSVNRDIWNSRMAGPLYGQVTPAADIEFALPPDEAHSKTEKASFALEQARSNYDIQELMRRLEQAQNKQVLCYQTLDKTAAWHHQPARVKRLADSAPEALARQHREHKAQLERIQARRHAIAVQSEHLKSQLNTASIKRPDNPPVLDETVMQSIEALGQEKQAVDQRLRSTQQDLKIAQDGLPHLHDTVHNWANKITLCKTCIGRIEGVHSIAANGLPRPVDDLESFDERIQTLKHTYDKARGESDSAKRAAESEWGKVSDLTHQESAKDEEVRAATLFLRNWQGQTFETALMNLEGLTRTIEDFHSTTLDYIDRIHQSMDVAVRDLEGHLERALTLLRRAKRVKIPDTSTVLAGRTVLRMDDRLDRADRDLNAKAKECLERWMREGRIPAEKGQRDLLTTDLVQSVFPEGHLEIRLIKTTTASNHTKYTPIDALEGSGGQLLTTAFLLFVTVAKVREMDTTVPSDGFLLADNPIGECNADSLLRIQMAMADAYNIQLIYLSGHTDPNAKSMFQNHLLLNKVGKLKNKELVGHLDEKHRLWHANLLAQPKPKGVEL